MKNYEELLLKLWVWIVIHTQQAANLKYGNAAIWQRRTSGDTEMHVALWGKRDFFHSFLNYRITINFSQILKRGKFIHHKILLQFPITVTRRILPFINYSMIYLLVRAIVIRVVVIQNTHNLRKKQQLFLFSS